MKVELIYHTPLWVASKAIRKCWASEDKSDTYLIEGEYYHEAPITHGGMCDTIGIGPKDKELIHRVGNKNKHASTLEHINYSFDIDGISRACLQELARHRHASMSVKSTRYTLKELKEEQQLVLVNEHYTEYLIDVAKKYIVMPPHANRYDKVWQGQVRALELLREELVYSKDSNDILKYMLPESYKTSLVWTINMRSLQNFLALRTNKAALWEIRDLANLIYNTLPEEHKYMYTEFIYKEIADV